MSAARAPARTSVSRDWSPTSNAASSLGWRGCGDRPWLAPRRAEAALPIKEGNGATESEDVTRADTGASVGPWARLAALHRQLADCYDDLAADPENVVAEPSPQSVHASVPPPTDRGPEFLTPTEVAERLQVHPRTLRRMELAGEIPAAIGSGRRKRWRARDIERLAEGEA